MKIAVYPGSFDPLTYGHLDVAERASKITDTLIIGVAENPMKQPIFTVEERMEMMQQATRHLKNVRVDKLEGLLIDYARKVGAQAVVRGLRAVSDFEYEFQMAMINRKLEDRIETLFLVTSENYSYLSSTMIREIAALDGDITPFVPEEIARRVKEKMQNENRNRPRSSGGIRD